MIFLFEYYIILNVKNNLNNKPFIISCKLFAEQKNRFIKRCELKKQQIISR